MDVSNDRKRTAWGIGRWSVDVGRQAIELAHALIGTQLLPIMLDVPAGGSRNLGASRSVESCIQGTRELLELDHARWKESSRYATERYVEVVDNAVYGCESSDSEIWIDRECAVRFHIVESPSGVYFGREDGSLRNTTCK